MKITQFLLAPALALGLTTTAMAQVSSPQPSPYEAQLTLVPVAGTTTNVSGSLTYDVDISQLQTNPDAPQALGAYNIFIDYNPAVVAVSGATIGSNLIVDSEGDLPYTGLVSSGQYVLSDVSLDSNSTEPHQGLGDFQTQATSFTIGTISLTGLSTGTSALTYDATTSLSDQNSNPIVFGSSGSTITATPEPSAGLMGILAVMMFTVLLARRRMQA